MDSSGATAIAESDGGSDYVRPGDRAVECLGLWHRFCSFQNQMHATFLQKVIICMVAGFLAACLIQWGKVFVQGADDALNKGYGHTAPALSSTGKP